MTSVITTTPASSSSAIFPPCTAEICGVSEAEKQWVVEKVASSSSSCQQTLSTGNGTENKKPTCEMTEKCVQSCAAYGKVCPCAARIAAHAACDAMCELKKDSHIFLSQQAVDGKPNFPYINAEDIIIGKKLGEGGFSNVNVCTMKNDPIVGKKYAVKYLKKKAMVDLHQFKHGAADLAVEAFFLQELKHPHIVTLHGVTAGSVETNLASGKECGFFIVVDHLVETLEGRLDRWRTEHEKNNHGIGSPLKLPWIVSSEYKQKRRLELLERIQIAIQIADAMHYLHSLGIVFRDLKPDNMGFDENNVLKIFDFGLAKELKSCLQNNNGIYNLTGNTGSRRYMAPEVAREAPYNQSVDVYSFGILLWELCSGEKPFYGFSSGKHMQLIVLNGERPSMDAHHTAYWPANLQWLMNHCWSPFPVVRPSFTVILEILNDIVDGKDGIPSSLLTNNTNTKMNQAIDGPPSGGFSSLFPHGKNKKRLETTGGINVSNNDDPANNSTNDLHSTVTVLPTKSKNKNNSTRSRSWGFVVRR